MYFDANGTMQFYDNETDNYWQNHFQLHWNQKYNSNWQSNIALHYTLGKGYFEQYKEDQDFAAYNLPSYNGNTTTDLVRKRWLDNAFSEQRLPSLIKTILLISLWAERQIDT